MRDEGTSTRVLPPPPDDVRLVVVIPCRNEARHIERCVRSLLDDDYPPHLLTVRVVDGMSDDGTRPIVEALARAHPQVELIDNIDRTTPKALNRGLRRGGYHAAIILGAHAEVEHGFLRANVDALRRDPTVGCVGGIIENVFEGDEARCIGAAMGHPFGVGSAHFRTGRREGYVDTVAFGCYRHEVFEAVGYFDEDLVRNQDDEFNFRVTQAGFRILLDHRIRSRYHVRASYARLFEQYAQYGFWKVYVNQKHRTVTTVRQLVPALWVAFVLLGMSLGGLSGIVAGGLLAGVAAYLVAAQFSAHRAAASPTDRWGVLQAFLVLHVGYGVGYLRGIWELLVLRRRPGARDQALTRGDGPTAHDRVPGAIAAHGVPATVFLMLFFYCLALWQQAAPAFMVLAGIALVAHHRREPGRRWPPITSPLWWAPLFYLLHVVGLLWSTNIDFGLFDLEVKAALLFVPLLHFAVPVARRQGGGLMQRAFAAGVAVSIAVDLAAALFRLARTHMWGDGGGGFASTSSELFSSRFSLFLHPSYAAMYAAFAVCWAMGSRAGAAGRAMLPLYLVGIVLFASKVGWIVLVVVLAALVVRAGRRAWAPVGVAIAVFATYTWSSPFMQEKLAQFGTMFRQADPAPDAAGSTDVRILVWRTAREVMHAHWPLGTGTGDVKDELVACYLQHGYVHPAELRLNAHSQFLQTGSALGLPGLLVLGGLLLVPLLAFVRRRAAVGAALMLLLAVEMAVESLLEVQAGVIFLAAMAWTVEWNRSDADDR